MQCTIWEIFPRDSQVCFAENALRIKERSPADTTFVVSLANGWLGYIPHKAAFDRDGGHESTWAFWSKMEPAAGEIIGDAIIELINDIWICDFND